MVHLSGKDRGQLLLLPEAADDYVGPDNPVRFIEAFVHDLDLNQVFVRASIEVIDRFKECCNSTGLSYGEALVELMAKPASRSLEAIVVRHAGRAQAQRHHPLCRRRYTPSR